MSPKPVTEHTLIYGDDRATHRECIPDESIDLVYLDPPFMCMIIQKRAIRDLIAISENRAT